MTRQRLIVLLVVVFLIVPLLVYGLFLAFFNRASVEQPYQITDRDTGEQVTVDPSRTPENDGGITVTVLGLDILTDDFVTPYQLMYLKQQISIYVSTKLQGKYGTVTLLPQSVERTESAITTLLRLGQTDTTVPIVLRADPDTGETQVIIEDPDNTFGGRFEGEILEYTED